MKLKKWVFVLFALALIFLLPTQAEAAIVDSGTCGENLTWTLDDAGKLTISGTGEMMNVPDREDPPWGTGIKTVVIQKGATSIGMCAFAGCENLTSVSIPDSVTTIEGGAFIGCKGLSSITIPNSVTYIWQQAFAFCTGLTEVYIPASVEMLGYGDVFYQCINLKGIRVDENNTRYSSDAYGVLFNKDKTELIQFPAAREGEYTIPGNVRSIYYGAFENSRYLTGVVVPEGVTVIKSHTFSSCYNLKSIKLPSSLTTIENDAFDHCIVLTDITIPGGVTSIGSRAFEGCGSLVSIVIPQGVTVIESSTFSDCGKLTSVSIPDGVVKIGYSAFSDCGSLSGITIPSGVKEIEFAAFSRCRSLKSLVIPAGITMIDDWTFDNCDSLKEVRFKGNAPTFTSLAFSSTTTNAYYPVGNATWTKDVMQNYGGTVTWASYDPDNYLSNVFINKVIAHKTGNILYWDAVPGGDIYQIYRLNGSKWELLKNTRSLGYKDETAKPGVKHYYKIVARNGNVKSDIKTTISASAIRPDTKLANVVINKTIAHSSGNIMYWDAVSGADLYQVYRLRSGDSSWTLLKNTSSLGYKDTTATPGVRYYYKIVARNGDVKSNIATTASTLIVRP